MHSKFKTIISKVYNQFNNETHNKFYFIKILFNKQL